MLALVIAGAAMLVPVVHAELPSMAPPLVGQRGGNSDAAHACQHGGYITLFREDHTGFDNTGECVSYAAHGGKFVTRVTATLTDVNLGACNELTWGYEIDGVQTDVDHKEYGCFEQSGTDQTVTYFSDQALRIYLRDNTCGDLYFEDGLHALVIGANPQRIEITDSGGFCESNPSLPRPPTGIQPDGGNLNLTRTIL